MKALNDKNEVLADRLRAFRLSLGLSQKEAADKFRIPFSTYKRYESGANEPTSEAVSVMMRMGLNANWLLMGGGQMLLTASEECLSPPITDNPKSPAKMMTSAGIPANAEGNPGWAIDENILSACHDACRIVYGDVFDKLPALKQTGYAADLYNLMVKMSAPSGKGINQMKRLESAGMVELLNVYIRLGWARTFPPKQSELYKW